MCRAVGEGSAAVARALRGALARPLRDRPPLADDEPRRVDLGGERQPSAVRRPGDLADPTVLARSCHSDRSRTRQVEDGDAGRRIVVGWIGPDERQRPPIRREARLGIARQPVGQLARPRDLAPGAQVDREQVPDVADPLDRAANHDRRPTVERQVEFLDDDHASEVGWSHRAARRHARQGSGDGVLRGRPLRGSGGSVPSAGCRIADRRLIRRERPARAPSAGSAPTRAPRTRPRRGWPPRPPTRRGPHPRTPSRRRVAGSASGPRCCRRT